MCIWRTLKFLFIDNLEERVFHVRIPGACAFLIVQAPAPRGSGHKSVRLCGRAPLRQPVLCLSPLTRRLRFSYCLAPAPSPSSCLGLQDVGHAVVAAGRGVFRQPSFLS